MTQVTEELRAGETQKTPSIDPSLRNKIVGGYGSVMRVVPPRRWWEISFQPTKPLITAVAAFGLVIVTAAILFPVFSNAREKARNIVDPSVAHWAAQPAAPPAAPAVQFSQPLRTDNDTNSRTYTLSTPSSTAYYSAPVNATTAGSSSAYNFKELGTHNATDGVTATDDLTRRVHNAATITVDVDDPEAKSDDIEAKVKGAGGYVAANNLTSGDDGRKTAELTVKVPVAQFETILGEVAHLGDVTAKNVTGEDITDKVSDATQQENVLEDEVNKENARLVELGKKAKWNDAETARDLRVQLAQSRARLVLLQKLGELSDLDITLTQKVKPTPPPASGFMNDMSQSTKDAFGSMFGAVSTLLTFVIWIAVYAPIWLPVGLVGRWLYRRSRVGQEQASQG